MSETKHTPLPWRYVLCDAGGEDIQDAPYISIQEDTKVPIISAAQIGPPIDGTDVANAKLIVTSVNARPKVEELVRAILESAEWVRGKTLYPESSYWEQAKQKAREVEAALRGKAEGLTDARHSQS